MSFGQAVEIGVEYQIMLAFVIFSLQPSFAIQGTFKLFWSYISFQLD